MIGSATTAAVASKCKDGKEISTENAHVATSLLLAPSSGPAGSVGTAFRHQFILFSMLCEKSWVLLASSFSVQLQPLTGSPSTCRVVLGLDREEVWDHSPHW